MGWAQTRDAVIAEVDALVARAQSLRDELWRAPSGCEGWTVGQVAAHVASVMDVQQTAFQHMLAGDGTTPDWANPPFVSAEATLDALTAAQAKAHETMGRLGDDHADTPVPLPFGTFPTEVALDILLLEYGTHRWDIARAADPSVRLSPAASECVLRLAPAFVAFFATNPPDEPIGYLLETDSVSLDVSARDGGWVLEASPVPTTVVRGDDNAIALFVVGRVTADDPRLSVTGADGASFKRWFPGP